MSKSIVTLSGIITNQPNSRYYFRTLFKPHESIAGKSCMMKVVAFHVPQEDSSNFDANGDPSFLIYTSLLQPTATANINNQTNDISVSTSNLTSGSWSVPVKGEFTPSTFIGMYNMAGTNTTDKLVYPMVNNVYPECLVSVPLIAQEIEVGIMWTGRYDSSTVKSVYFGETDTTNPGTKLNPRFMTIMLEFTPTET
jgi:hypothetical protein